MIDLEASRQLIRHACAVLHAGERGTHESSVAKVFVSEAVNRVATAPSRSTAASACPTTCRSRATNEVRPFRIYDGPSETHRWSIARRVARRRAEERAG